MKSSEALDKKKSNYITPEVEVIKLSFESALLENSNEGATEGGSYEWPKP